MFPRAARRHSRAPRASVASVHCTRGRALCARTNAACDATVRSVVELAGYWHQTPRRFTDDQLEAGRVKYSRGALQLHERPLHICVQTQFSGANARDEQRAAD